MFSDEATEMETEHPTDGDEGEETVEKLWKRLEELEKQYAVLDNKQNISTDQHNTLKGLVKANSEKLATVEQTAK